MSERLRNWKNGVENKGGHCDSFLLPLQSMRDTWRVINVQAYMRNLRFPSSFLAVLV